MRKKVDDLAVWVAEGDKARLREARQAIVQLLCAAAGMTDIESELKKPRARRKR
jgi:hypothetical protein